MPARLVAAIAIVVRGEKVAVYVEGEFLRIAQSPRDDFKVAAVRVRAKDAAGIGHQFRRETGNGVLDLREKVGVRPAVGDGPVELAVGSENQAVHVVPAEG